MNRLQNPASGLSDQFAIPAKGLPPKSKRRRAPPFSLRLSAAERQRLEQDAGETPLATYIKFRIFTQTAGLTKRAPSEVKLIAQLLAALGEARLANNLNQLAKAANMGTLDVTPETEKQLQDAYVEILWMRYMLMRALGLKGERPTSEIKASAQAKDMPEDR